MNSDQAEPGARESAASLSRRHFLRQAGSLLGAGTAVLLFADQAKAEGGTSAPGSYTCCRESSCDFCPNPDRRRYLCTPGPGCDGSPYCDCFNESKPECFTVAC